MQKIFQTDRAELKLFGKNLAIGGPVIGTLALGMFLWKDKEHFQTVSFIFYGLALYGFLGRFTIPMVLFPGYVVLTTVGNGMQWLMSTIVLGFVYFGMLTPIAIVFRLKRRNRLQLDLDRSAQSYWEPRETVKIDPEKYEKQY